ncbi:MAG: hypothetical protein FRX49_10342 [Trebouxia sp. A1-2]|nr:MAG: hypothetical protein FRX49_10342 [Trebouxia sp. A1-2]
MVIFSSILLETGGQEATDSMMGHVLFEWAAFGGCNCEGGNACNGEYHEQRIRECQGSIDSHK